MREVGREVGGHWRVRGARAPGASVPRPLPPPILDEPLDHSAPRQRLGAQHFGGARRRTSPLARRTRLRPILAAAMAAAALFAVITDGGRATRPAVLPWPDVDAALAWAGFGVDQVSVSGHRFTPDGDILDALGLAAARSWRAFDSRAARDRIEQLPWVASATLTRRYPGQLDVRVTERTAFAVWEHGGRETLIDQTGRVLSDLRPGSAATAQAGLWRIRGEGANGEAAGIAATVARHPWIARRLALAERIAGRRWTLHLDNGTRLHLPPDREALVLDGLTSSPRLKRLVEAPGRVIDLRSPGRIAVRGGPGTPLAKANAAQRLADGGP